MQSTATRVCKKLLYNCWLQPGSATIAAISGGGGGLEGRARGQGFRWYEGAAHPVTIEHSKEAQVTVAFPPRFPGLKVAPPCRLRRFRDLASIQRVCILHLCPASLCRELPTRAAKVRDLAGTPAPSMRVQRGGRDLTTPQYLERSSSRELEIDRVRVVLGVEALHDNSSSRGLRIGDGLRISVGWAMAA